MGEGVTLHSVSVEFPDPARMFPGDSKADAINNNCLACHSAGMVLTQPSLSRAEWQSEVEKMRSTYKAPVEESDVPAIVDYLVALKDRK
jgi:cytochrome c5